MKSLMTKSLQEIVSSLYVLNTDQVFQSNQIYLSVSLQAKMPITNREWQEVGLSIETKRVDLEANKNGFIKKIC